MSLASATTAADAAAADDNDVGDDDNDQKLIRTVVVYDVSADMEDVVSVYLENPRKNGGPIETSFYNPITNQLSVCFVSQQGMYLQLCYFTAENPISLKTTTQQDRHSRIHNSQFAFCVPGLNFQMKWLGKQTWKVKLINILHVILWTLFYN